MANLASPENSDISEYSITKNYVTAVKKDVWKPKLQDRPFIVSLCNVFSMVKTQFFQHQ